LNISENMSQAREDVTGRLMAVLQAVETPMEMHEFRRSVGRLVKERLGCKVASYWYDKGPRREVEEKAGDTAKRVVEHHVDTVACDYKLYHVEAVYEVVEDCQDEYCERTVLSFKPLKVWEGKELRLKSDNFSLVDFHRLLRAELSGAYDPSEPSEEEDREQEVARELVAGLGLLAELIELAQLSLFILVLDGLRKAREAKSQ